MKSKTHLVLSRPKDGVTHNSRTGVPVEGPVSPGRDSKLLLLDPLGAGTQTRRLRRASDTSNSLSNDTAPDRSVTRVPRLTLFHGSRVPRGRDDTVKSFTPGPGKKSPELSNLDPSIIVILYYTEKV